MGDMLVAIPAIRLIRNAYPESRITLLTCASTKVAQFGTMLSYADKGKALPWLTLIPASLVDEVVDFTWRQDVDGLFWLRGRLTGDYDKAFILGYACETMLSWAKKWLFLRLMGIHCTIYGRSSVRDVNEVLHQVEVPLRIAREDPTIADKGAFPGFGLDVAPDASAWAERQWILRKLREREVVAVFPGGTHVHKRWPREAFEKLCKWLEGRENVFILFVGSSSERQISAEIAGRLVRESWNSCGELELSVLAAVLSRCRLFVGNDSGPGHLAAALNVPCVTLMSAIHREGLWEPWGRNNIALRNTTLCSPCRCETYCPKGTLECIFGISVESSVTACMRILDGQKR